MNHESKKGTGLLLLHSIGSDHREMDRLAACLRAEGYMVDAPDLPGHGTEMKAMRETNTAGQRAFVRERIDQLNKECTRVVVVGQSLGALLTLDAAEGSDTSVSGVVLISTPLRFWTPFIAARHVRTPSELIMRHVPMVPRLFTLVRDPATRAEHHVYRGWTGNSLADLVILAEEAEANLDRLTQPALIIHSRRDFVAHPKSVAILEARLPNIKGVLWQNEGGHILTLDYGRDRLQEAVLDFLDALEQEEKR